MGPPECVKGEEGYPFFNNTSAIEEWKRIEFFIKQSLEMTNAYDLNQQGMLLLSRGDREGALQSFFKAVDVDPKLISAHNNIGLLYWEAGDKNKALKYFANAFEVDPTDEKLIANILSVLRTLEKYQF